MESNNNANAVVHEVQGGEIFDQKGQKKKNNVNQPLMILSSGKVVGNIGE